MNTTKEDHINTMEDISAEAIQVIQVIRHPDVTSQMEEDKELIYEKVNRRITADKKVALPRKYHTRILYVAAVVALLIASTVSTYYYAYRKGSATLSETLIETTVPYGSMSRMTLADGTKVILNGGSKLVYPASFLNSRQVSLSGEAFFDVARDEKSPFIVHSHKLSVKVLGTRFAFKAYEEDAETTLTLESGSISALPRDIDKEVILLEPDQQLIFDKETRELQRRRVDSKAILAWKDGHVLKPGEQLSLDNQSGKLAKKKVDVEDFTLWKEGVLTFRDHTLGEIALILERRFDTKIHIASEQLKNERYGAQFRYGESMDLILDKLSFKRSWKYTKEEGKYTITAK
ncbi:transmembrane sensor [Parabacteroides sp. PFB2-12]|uniref:FecR family protein n=1 Tax=unclassified Parabacteroides TaxID=2649774 RepID=UPI002474A0FB|nr:MULTISPECIES: FecR domain-containing protein [unclassified Parabacteroides]MDH6341844.1 transmembrane sensor [Parabacteroides sp. PM6-13]MDH6391617.1 transmembrane sensor [Parabacteroides sp. PFB2-12]